MDIYIYISISIIIYIIYIYNHTLIYTCIIIYIYIHINWYIHWFTYIYNLIHVYEHGSAELVLILWQSFVTSSRVRPPGLFACITIIASHLSVERWRCAGLATGVAPPVHSSDEKWISTSHHTNWPMIPSACNRFLSFFQLVVVCIYSVYRDILCVFHHIASYCTNLYSFYWFFTFIDVQLVWCRDSKSSTQACAIAVAEPVELGTLCAASIISGQRGRMGARAILPRQWARAGVWRVSIPAVLCEKFWQPMVKTEEACYIQLIIQSCNANQFFAMVEDGGKPPVVEFGMGLKFDHILCARNKKAPASCPMCARLVGHAKFWS